MPRRLPNGTPSTWTGGEWIKNSKRIRDESYLRLRHGDGGSYLAIEDGLRTGSIYRPEHD